MLHIFNTTLVTLMVDFVDYTPPVFIHVLFTFITPNNAVQTVVLSNPTPPPPRNPRPRTRTRTQRTDIFLISYAAFIAVGCWIKTIAT